LAEALIRQEEVIALRVDEASQTVLCQTSQPDAFYAKIPTLLLGAGISVRQLTSPDDNLQAVFTYLTEG
jgi:ABC-2 type transport system ATP-binding protein